MMDRLDKLKIKYRQLQDKVREAQEDADDAQALADRAEQVNTRHRQPRVCVRARQTVVLLSNQRLPCQLRA